VAEKEVNIKKKEMQEENDTNEQPRHLKINLYKSVLVFYHVLSLQIACTTSQSVFSGGGPLCASGSCGLLEGCLGRSF
jgi:hypothetical protein